MIGSMLAAAVLFAQVAPAATPAPDAAPPAAAAPAGETVAPAIITGKKPPAADPGKVMVCRTEPVLGTLFPKKICATRDQLTERTRIDQQWTRETGNLRPYKVE